LVEAFRWSVTRKVTKTASVPLEGNQYSVDPSLVGRRVELRFGPEDLTVIDVFFEGKPAGVAIPFVIGRHTHKRVPQAAPTVPEATGIDYLGMVAAAHEGAAGTGGKIDYAQLAGFGADQTENRDEVTR
jgi:putative transposase